MTGSFNPSTHLHLFLSLFELSDAKLGVFLYPQPGETGYPPKIRHTQHGKMLHPANAHNMFQDLKRRDLSRIFTMAIGPCYPRNR